MAKVLQLTLAVIKPDAVAHPLMLEVRSRLHVNISVFWGCLFTVFKAKLSVDLFIKWTEFKSVKTWPKVIFSLLFQGSSSENPGQQLCDRQVQRSGLEATGLWEVLRWTFRSGLMFSVMDAHKLINLHLKISALFWWLSGRFFYQRLVEFMSRWATFWRILSQRFPCLSQQPISLSGSSHDFCCCSCHSGPMRAYVLAREDAIRHWRDLMGPTKVFRARHTSPASIRAQFGLTDTRNTTHGSGRSPLCVLISTQIIIPVRSQLISAVKEKPREGEDRRSKIIVACFFSFNRGTLNKI